jgi:hypothetical protein
MTFQIPGIIKRVSDKNARFNSQAPNAERPFEAALPAFVLHSGKMPARMRSVGKNVCSLYEIDVEQFAARVLPSRRQSLSRPKCPGCCIKKMFLEWNSLWITLDKALVL